MNTLGTYHNQFVIGTGREGGRGVCLCVCVCVLVFAVGMITLSGKKGRQHCLFNSVIDSTGIESGRGGKKHLSANLVNRAWQAHCR